MRILIHDYAGHPFQVQLSRQLAKVGHEVLHLYSGSINTPRGALNKNDADPVGFNIRPIFLDQEIKKYSFVSRFRQESEYGRKLAAEISSSRPDVVLTANTPSLVLQSLVKACRRTGCRLVSWIQDLYGLAAYRILKKKLPGIGHLAGRYFMRLDRQACLASDQVVVISEDFKDVLAQQGVPDDKIHVVHNWAPLEELPLRSRDNEWSLKLGLTKEVRFLYSGTLSIRHNPDLLLQLGIHLDQLGRGELTVVSQGEGAEWLKSRVAEHGVQSIRILPFQPFEEMPNVFGSADVLIGILEPEAGVFCVPSKMLSYMCAQRALLAAIPKENLSARIIEGNSAGLVVDPRDSAAFVQAADELATSSSLRLKMGLAARNYAETHFDIERICDRFEQLLGGATEPHSADRLVRQSIDRIERIGA
ncbi:glycosyltransferase family 4 protein [Thalassoroseus pseudoceratinae]|uniref:glycosyltransferase family 4 protein n=1 Tax=Thalassoroseus pseudoceratinae TaxID=2713176 RepID=UPI0014224BA7|nr:glycosyltransferase family 4 protein [Thalassoroseus pseudoceratinae]